MKKGLFARLLVISESISLY